MLEIISQKTYLLFFPCPMLIPWRHNDIATICHRTKRPIVYQGISNSTTCIHRRAPHGYL